MIVTAANPKQQDHQLIDQLPESATWDDAVYEMAVRRSIECGFADAGRLAKVKDARCGFSLPE